MSEKKSLVEETLLQMEDLQEALTENAKGILASTMKEEISELVKESLVDEPVEEVEKSETEMTEQLDVEDMEDEDEMVDDMSDDDLEDLDGLLDMDADMSDNELGDEEEMDMEMGMDMDLPDELEVEDGEELLPLDLTGASDDDVLKVFKAMGEKDGIIVTQDEDDIKLSDEETDSEYIIQMESEESDEVISDEDLNNEELEEEVIYEIELDEETTEEWNEGENLDRKGSVEEETTEEYSEEEEVKEEMSEEETTEGDETAEEYSEGEEEGEVAERSHARLRRQVRMSEPTKRYAKHLTRESENKELKEEVQQLREKNEEYRKALNVFREKLNEVAVFISNLAYATRLFTENSTTKKEKINILRRFDSVESLKESKSLYKTLKEELGGKEQEVVTETVNRTINSTPTKGSSTNLIENKTYENPQFQRVRDLMNKIK
jgi:hypothetical protein